MAFTKISVLAAAALATVATANTVTLYDGVLFQGESVTFGVSYTGNACTNVPSWFNDRASSATWNLDHYVNGRIYLYEHANCQGRSISWDVDGNGSPNYLPTDNFDNMISSVQFVRDYERPPHSPPGGPWVAASTADALPAATQAPAVPVANASEAHIPAPNGNNI